MNHLTTLSKRLIAFLMALTMLISVVPAMAEALPEIEAVVETEMLEKDIQNLEESVDEVSIIELPPDDETVISDLPDEDSVASEFINDLPESETTTDNETVDAETEIAEDEMPAEEAEEVLPSEETVPEEAADDVNQEKTEPEIPVVEEAEDPVEEVNPEEGVSEELPAEEAVSELMNPVQAAVAEKGYTYLMTDDTIPVYETEQLQKLVFTLYPENLILVSAYLEQDNRNVLEVRFYASEEMAVIGYVDALSLSDQVLGDEEIRSFVADSPYFLDFVGNGKVAIFLASGEMPAVESQIDMEDNELEETEQEVLPEEELVPGEEPGVLPEEDSTQIDTGSENESVVETHPGEDVISESIPSVEESTQDIMEEAAEDLPEEPEKVYASCLDYLLVTEETVVYSDVDCSIDDEYLGDLAMGYFIRDSVVQVRDVIMDENNRVWYQVNYLYGDDRADGRMKWTDITSVFVLASQTEVTDETELTITDFAFKTKPQMRMMVRSTPMNGFRLKELNDPMGDFYAGQSNLHGSSGRDVEYTQIATLPGRGNIYATPHYLEGYTVYCLEHLLPGPGENISGGRKEPTGPYLMVDMQEYINTPGYSGVMYSESTMHAIAWVLRHTYPFMVLDRTDPSNETWSRVAGQFAIREVIKELEGPQYLRDYWLMDEFYASSNNAPAVYLEYARWLAANGIARARITGEILIADQHVTIVNGKTVGTVTLSTDADLIRIPLAAGEVSGNTAGNDDQYYYLHSGDTVQISSELRQFSVTVESISSPDEEACFLVGVPDAPIQKVLVPQKGTPYKLGDNILDFEVVYGSLQAMKKDSVTDLPLAGATFDLLQDGVIIQSKTTGADGIVVFYDLLPGTYSVQESKAPDGYVLNTASVEQISVEVGEIAEVEFFNRPIRSKVQIVKTDTLTNEAVSGAEFTIQDAEGNVVAVMITDANGQAVSDWLPYGVYTVTETKVPAGYKESGFVTEIKACENEKIYTVEVQNEPNPGSIRLTKTDALNGNTIAGVKFNVYQGDTLITTMTTNKNGVATVENLPKGKYTVKEATLPEGYAGDLVELEAVVMSDQVTELVAQNTPSQSKVKIMKRDALTDEPVAGAEFTITNQKKEVVAVLVTGNDGTTVSDWLPYGVYTVKETKAAEHYENSGFTAKVEAYEDGKTYELDVENTPNKGQIQITKMDALTGKTISGVQFDIFQGDTLVGIMKTDKNGVAVSDKLEKGQYTVKEHENPVGYVAELVTLEALVESDETTVLTAVNTPIQGKVRIEKTDALTGEMLAGAEFTIMDQDSNEVAVLTTDENGVAESPLLTYGTYRVKETKVPEHYEDTGYIFDVTIDIHEKTYVLPVSNEPAKGWIRLTKTDRMNGNPIEGVQFDIYHNDQYGNGLAGSMVTDKNGVAFSEPLRKGQYIVREHGETPGYVFEELQLDATVKSDEITELAATNQPVMVQLKIYKRDLEEYDGDNPNSDPKKRKKVRELPVISAPVTRGDGVLVGTEFEVYAGADILDRQGNVIHKKGDRVIESLTTAGEDASVTTEPLWPGLYAIREKKAPEGYLIDTEPFFVDASDAAEQSSLVTVSYAGLSRNEIMYGAQAIVKLLGDSNMNADPTRVETPEEGAEFVVYLQSAGSFEAAREYERDVLVTDENGYAMTKPLPYGIYVLEQTKGKPGYEIKGSIPFQIDGTENLMNPPPMALNDVPILYRLRFIKVDAETGNSITLANTSFKLKDADGNYVKHQVHYPSEQWVDTFVTDETGSVTLPETVNWGMYYLQEVKAPEGYLIHADDFAVFVGNNTDLPGNTYKLAIEIPNEPVKGRILLDKTGLQLTGYDVQTDPWGNEVHVPVYEEQYLAGAVFEVRAAEDVIGKDGTVWYKQGDLADTITTTQQGSDASKLLPLGKYSLIETQAPRGYFFDPMPIPVELSYKGDHTAVVELRVEVGNDYYPAEVMLSKEIDELNIITSSTDGIKSTLSRGPGEGFIFGLFNRYDMPYANGTLMADTLVATGITNENGELVLKGKYPYGNYYIRELSGPDGWKLSSEMVPVTIGTEYVNRKDQVLRVVLDEPIHNELLHTRVTLTKTDITGEKTLPGAVIEVMNAKGQVVYRDKTDEYGQIANIPVMPGTYTFREVYAPDGYALSEAVMTFTVEKDGTVIGDTVIRDDYTRFSILKTDQHGNVLPGVTFGLYQQDGTLLMTAITDKNGKATFERVSFGTYEISEMKPPVGYVASLVRIPVKLDGTWVNPEDPLETVVNVPNYVLVRKTDPDGMPLPGAVFVMHDEYGDCFGRAVTDASGLARFEKMPYGHYYIREEAAPEGYLVNKEVVEVVIDSSYQSKEEPIATIVNQRKRVRFIKVDTSGRRMPDVEFTMYNALTDEVVEVVESNEKGEFIFTKFDFGSWIIRETRCPEGYTPIEDILLEVDETWVEPKAITLVNIPNHYAFQKTDHWYRPLEGVWFNVEDSEGHILQEVCSGEDGMVYISDLVPGRYIIRETDAAEGFTRTEEIIEVIIDEKYVASTKPYRLVNYPRIETGVYLTPTTVNWIGAGLMVLAGGIFFISRKKKRKEKK